MRNKIEKLLLHFIIWMVFDQDRESRVNAFLEGSLEKTLLREFLRNKIGFIRTILSLTNFERLSLK